MLLDPKPRGMDFSALSPFRTTYILVLSRMAMAC